MPGDRVSQGTDFAEQAKRDEDGIGTYVPNQAIGLSFGAPASAAESLLSC